MFLDLNHKPHRLQELGNVIYGQVEKKSDLGKPSDHLIVIKEMMNSLFVPLAHSLIKNYPWVYFTLILSPGIIFISVKLLVMGGGSSISPAS